MNNPDGEAPPESPDYGNAMVEGAARGWTAEVNLRHCIDLYWKLRSPAPDPSDAVRQNLGPAEVAPCLRHVSQWAGTADLETGACKA